MLLHVHTPKHEQKELEVWYITRANQTFDYTFLFDLDMYIFCYYYRKLSVIKVTCMVKIKLGFIDWFCL